MYTLYDEGRNYATSTFDVEMQYIVLMQVVDSLQHLLDVVESLVQMQRLQYFDPLWSLIHHQHFRQVATWGGYRKRDLMVNIIQAIIVHSIVLYTQQQC